MAEQIAISLEQLFDQADLKQALDNGRAAFAKDASLINGLSWPIVRDGIAEALRGEHKFDLLDWLANGWTVARELHELRDAPAANPGIAKFGKRKVSGTIHPVVSFAIAGGAPVEIRLSVDIVAEFAAVTVKVAERHIRECGCGTCNITVQLKYQDAALSSPQKLKPIELPLQHSFTPPIAIP